MIYPDGTGIRAKEIESKTFEEISIILASRLQSLATNFR